MNTMQIILKHLENAPMTATALTGAMGIRRERVMTCLRALRHTIRVVDWVGYGGNAEAVWAVGSGPHAPRPDMPPLREDQVLKNPFFPGVARVWGI